MRNLIVAAVLVAIAVPALAGTFWSPSAGKMVRCDPTELPVSPDDWAKVDPCAYKAEWEQRSQLKPAPTPTLKTEAEITADTTARTLTGALYAGLDLEARLASATAFKARLHAAGVDEKAVDAVIAALNEDMAKVMEALK